MYEIRLVLPLGPSDPGPADRGPADRGPADQGPDEIKQRVHGHGENRHYSVKPNPQPFLVPASTHTPTFQKLGFSSEYLIWQQYHIKNFFISGYTVLCNYHVFGKQLYSYFFEQYYLN